MTTGVRARRTLPELLDAAVATSPAAEVAFPRERATWTALRERSRRVAAGLAAAGVGHGDRVLLVLPGGLDAVVVTIAATMLGALPTPLNPRGTADEIAWLRRDADAAVVVATPELASLAGPGAAHPGRAGGRSRRRAIRRRDPRRPDDPAVHLRHDLPAPRLRAHARRVHRARREPRRAAAPRGGRSVLDTTAAVPLRRHRRAHGFAGRSLHARARRDVRAPRGVAAARGRTGDRCVPGVRHDLVAGAGAPGVRSRGRAGAAHRDQRGPGRRMAAMQARLPGAVQISSWAGRRPVGSAAWARWTTRPRSGPGPAGCR